MLYVNYTSTKTKNRIKRGVAIYLQMAQQRKKCKYIYREKKIDSKMVTGESRVAHTVLSTLVYVLNLPNGNRVGTQEETTGHL